MSKDFTYQKVTNLDEWKQNSTIGIEERVYTDEGYSIDGRWIFLTPTEQQLWDKIHQDTVSLGDQTFADPFTGIQTSCGKVFVIEKWVDAGEFITFTDHKGDERNIEKNILKPYLLPANRGGTSFRTFETKENDGWVIFPYEDGDIIPEDELERDYPNTFEYLSDNRVLLDKVDRRTGSPEWYGFGRTQALTKIENQPKIICGVLFKEERYIYDNTNMYFQTGDTAGYVGIRMINQSYNIFYVLGLLNHPILEWVSSKIASSFVGNYIAHGQTVLNKLPIKKIDFEKPEMKKIHDDIVTIVTKLIELHRELKEAVDDRKIGQKKDEIKTEREELENKIYSLYDVTTDEEKRIIHEADVG